MTTTFHPGIHEIQRNTPRSNTVVGCMVLHPLHWQLPSPTPIPPEYTAWKELPRIYKSRKIQHERIHTSCLPPNNCSPFAIVAWGEYYMVTCRQAGVLFTPPSITPIPLHLTYVDHTFTLCFPYLSFMFTLRLPYVCLTRWSEGSPRAA